VKENNMQVFLRPYCIWLPMGLLIFGGCGQQQLDEASETVSQMAEKTEQAAEDAALATGEMAEDVTSALGEGFSAAAEKASAALEGIEGGGELLSGLKELFASVQRSLAEVTDQASAKSAVSALGDLSNSTDKLSQIFGNLPDEAKAAIQGVVEQGIAQLETLMDKVLAIPGVREILQPKLDELITKLREFTRSPAAQ
jgi:hypothetical protein